MRRNRIIVLIMTLLLSLTAAAIVYYQEQWEDFPLTVIVESEGDGRKSSAGRKSRILIMYFSRDMRTRGRRKFRRIGFTPYLSRAKELGKALSSVTSL